MNSVVKIFPLFIGVALLSGCESLQSIDRGLYSAAEVVSERDLVTGQRTLSMASRGQQIAQGNAAVEQILAEQKKAGKKTNAALDEKAYQRVVRVFDRIHRVSHLANERWLPVLIDDPSFNAFTTGGTYIVVHSGLMQDLKDDAELAAVLGHEIAHTVANHVFERQTHQTAALIAGSEAARQGGYQAAFTHESEIEADKIGILYAALAGFDPYAASRIWERQYKKEGSAKGLFFHSHPVNPERALLTRNVANQVKQYYHDGQQNPEAAALLDNNALWRKGSESVEAGSGGGLSAILGTALGAYAQHQGTKQEASRQAQQIQMMQALDKQVVVVGEKVIDQHSWQVVWENRSNVSLKDVVMGVLIKDSTGKVSRYVTHVAGNIKPAARFAGSFTLPDLKVAQLQQMQVKYYLDDATPFR
ncbi:M48 family metallopeptidase [Neptunomonas sp.]|uniref:M48 family metallopeptidase n=1 Tax=Neptunomonas sp. TaxID=1971898 RepID=UPI003564300F